MKRAVSASDNFKRICAAVCLCLMCIAMLAVFLRFFTNRLVISKSGMESAIARAVFADFDGETPREEIDSSQYETENFYIRKINVVKSVIEVYSNKLMCLREEMIFGAYSYDNFIKWSAPKDPSDSGRIIYMQNGYLTFIQPKLNESEIEEIAVSIKDLNDYLEILNIPLLYVNAGSKVDSDDKELSAYDRSYEFTNENANALITACRERGIAVLDMRDELKKVNSDWYSLYYRTDHHWTTEAALEATAVLADFLNSNLNFEYDVSLFGAQGFESTRYEKIMFGSQGRSVTKANADMEDYVCILPRDLGNFRFEVPYENMILSGKYTDTLYDLEALEKIKKYTDKDILEKPDAYNATRMNNYPSAVIINDESRNNNDKKILLIQDSFGWYVSTYLATQTGRIDTFNPISSEESLKSYVSELKPDVVIILCNQRTINPLSAAGTDSFWYFE